MSLVFELIYVKNVMKRMFKMTGTKFTRTHLKSAISVLLCPLGSVREVGLGSSYKNQRREAACFECGGFGITYRILFYL